MCGDGESGEAVVKVRGGELFEDALRVEKPLCSVRLSHVGMEKVVK
jgi:hypothetical protein